jgi:hypothetical protein
VNVRAHDPFFWLKQAKELDRAAMLLWSAIRTDIVRILESHSGDEMPLEDLPYVNLGGIFWLNAGLALENLFKGSIIQREPQLVVNGTITRHLKTHNLLSLAKRAEFPLTGLDIFYLWIASECVRWAGRYPCSTKANETAPPVFSEADVMAYRHIFDRLLERFSSTLDKQVYFVRLPGKKAAPSTK